MNQFSVVENKHSRRPDIVLFVNVLPLAVMLEKYEVCCVRAVRELSQAFALAVTPEGVVDVFAAAGLDVISI